MSDDILDLAYEVSRVTGDKIHLIDSVMSQARFLAINTRIEAARAGQAGVAFSILADEMGKIAGQIVNISAELRSAIAASTGRLRDVGSALQESNKGNRFTDLALNVVELIDRNLYERSCDVRWWATDSAVVEALEAGTPEACRFACARLATILKSYTVYLDLFIVNASGQVVACGKPEQHRALLGRNMREEGWFAQAMQTRSGDDYVVADINRLPALNDAQAAIYATAIRAGGACNGKVLGVLGIAFDWRPQAEAIVSNVRLTDAERHNTRVMLVDATRRVIASSDNNGVLTEQYDFKPEQPMGFYRHGNRLVAYALTPGYETYKGLGWYGVIEAAL